MRDLSPEDAKLMEGVLERLTKREFGRNKPEDPETKAEPKGAGDD